MKNRDEVETAKTAFFETLFDFLFSREELLDRVSKIRENQFDSCIKNFSQKELVMEDRHVISDWNEFVCWFERFLNNLQEPFSWYPENISERERICQFARFAKPEVKKDLGERIVFLFKRDGPGKISMAMREMVDELQLMISKDKEEGNVAGLAA